VAAPFFKCKARSPFLLLHHLRMRSKKSDKAKLILPTQISRSTLAGVSYLETNRTRSESRLLRVCKPKANECVGGSEPFKRLRVAFFAKNA
jgi:hypothetical protein